MTSKSIQPIRREKFEGSIIEEGIIYFRFFENEVIELSDIKESFEIHDLLAVDENIKRIIHSEKYGTISKAGRDLVQSSSRPAKAEAFVITSMAQKIIFNLFVKLRKQKHPIRAFDDLNDALKWIRKK
jgi:hypothetical protein